jgi:hypothetical protein
MQGSGFTSLIFLAFQLVAKIPAETFLQNRNAFRSPDPEALPVGNPILSACDVIFNMAAHWKNEEDLLEKISTSIFLLNCLEATGYFSQLDQGNVTNVYLQHQKSTYIRQKISMSN